MSRWQHNICDPCWERRCQERGELDRKPHRLVAELNCEATCCYCRAPTRSGIRVQDDPLETPCRGQHEGEWSPFD